MSANPASSKVILGTLCFLSVLAFFIAGGVFASNVKVPEAIGNIGGLCFFLWWLPALIGFISRKAVRRLLFTELGSISAIVACAFILAGSISFFIAALFLTSGPITPRAQAIGDFCLNIWWIPGLIGIAAGAITVIYGIDDPIIDDAE